MSIRDRPTKWGGSFWQMDTLWIHGLGWGRKQENTRGMHSLRVRAAKTFNQNLTDGDDWNACQKRRKAAEVVKNGRSKIACSLWHFHSVGRPAGREFKKHPLPTTHSLRECNKFQILRETKNDDGMNKNDAWKRNEWRGVRYVSILLLERHAKLKNCTVKSYWKWHLFQFPRDFTVYLF